MPAGSSIFASAFSPRPPSGRLRAAPSLPAAAAAPACLPLTANRSASAGGTGNVGGGDVFSEVDQLLAFMFR